ncbi:MAG: GNAT family N-acetyltransferase [Gaiellales bacterium]
MTLRPPSDADAEAVAALASEHWPTPIDAESVLHSWNAPTIDRERDVRVEPDGYARVEEIGEDRVWISLAGAPSDELMEWMEARAGESGRRIFSGCASTHEQLGHRLAERGFRVIRCSQRMEIDLAQPAAEPVWPDGVSVRAFIPGDENAFYDVHQESFRDHWEPVETPYDEWRHYLVDAPTFDPEIWFLATEGDSPTGVAICLVRPAAPDTGMVGILGVLKPWRHRGIGRALLLHAFAEFRRKGLTRAALGVDSESLSGAHLLYESAGMHVTHRFDIYEKELE